MTELTKIETNLFSGYFAVTDPDDGILKFYKIDIPKDGRWRGYTFLSIQASENFYPIKNKEHRERILDEIKKNPLEASMRYGQKLGFCGICGKTLTDEISRKNGIGPICLGKMR